MEKVDLIVLSKWLIPMTNDVDFYEDYSLVVKDEKIVDILPNSQVLQKYSSDNVLKLDKDHVLMPGLVNCHTHSSMSLIRSYVDNVTLMDWLQSFIWPTEGKFVSHEFVHDGTELAISEMIKTGTTCFHDMYFFPQATAEVVDKSGIRACIGTPVIKFPTNFAKDENDYFLKAEEFVNKYKNHSRIILAISPHAPYTVSDSGFKGSLEFSKKHNILIHTHLHETEFEVINEKRENNGEPVRPIVRLNELGILSSNFIAAHMVHANDEDIQILSSTKSSIVHCPQSNMKLASGVAPIKKFLESGVNVCLGTDNVDNLDMFNDIKVSGLLAKIKENSGKALAAKTILTMATINGAKGLGVGDKIGSLEKGKFADFIAIKMDSKPVYNPINSLVYVGLGVNKVTHSWVSGKLLLDNGKLTTLDESSLEKKTDIWREKIIISQKEHLSQNK